MDWRLPVFEPQQKLLQIARLAEVNTKRILISVRVDVGFPGALHIDQVDVLHVQAKVLLVLHVLRLLVDEQQLPAHLVVRHIAYERHCLLDFVRVFAQGKQLYVEDLRECLDIVRKLLHFGQPKVLVHTVWDSIVVAT